MSWLADLREDGATVRWLVGQHRLLSHSPAASDGFAAGKFVASYARSTDPTWLLESAGFGIERTRLGAARGGTEAAVRYRGGRLTVAVDPAPNPSERTLEPHDARLVENGRLAHELGHIVLHLMAADQTPPRNSPRTAEESWCDEFARGLLLHAGVRREKGSTKPASAA